MLGILSCGNECCVISFIKVNLWYLIFQHAPLQLKKEKKNQFNQENCVSESHYPGVISAKIALRCERCLKGNSCVFKEGVLIAIPWDTKMN